MNRISKHIPNALTCCNLVSGCMACIVALEGSYLLAMIYIFISVGFDFADGLAARLLNAYSPIGKDLDSLADMVSFGVAPGMMLFHFINNMLQVQIVSDLVHRSSRTGTCPFLVITALCVRPLLHPSYRPLARNDVSAVSGNISACRTVYIAYRLFHTGACHIAADGLRDSDVLAENQIAGMERKRTTVCAGSFSRYTHPLSGHCRHHGNDSALYSPVGLQQT